MFIYFNGSLTRSYIRVVFKIGHKITKKKSNRKEKKQKNAKKYGFVIQIQQNPLSLPPYNMKYCVSLKESQTAPSPDWRFHTAVLPVVL